MRLRCEGRWRADGVRRTRNEVQHEMAAEKVDRGARGHAEEEEEVEDAFLPPAITFTWRRMMATC